MFFYNIYWSVKLNSISLNLLFEIGTPRYFAIGPINNKTAFVCWHPPQAYDILYFIQYRWEVFALLEWNWIFIESNRKSCFLSTTGIIRTPNLVFIHQQCRYKKVALYFLFVMRKELYTKCNLEDGEKQLYIYRTCIRLRNL